MIILLACIFLGVCLFLGMIAFRSIGGSFAGTGMRRRMKEAGFDPAEKRLEEWGLEEEKRP